MWAAKTFPDEMKFASAVLGAVSAVAGVVSLIPVVGEVALSIAITASVLETVDDVGLAEAGEGSWSAVGWDALSDVSFGFGGGLSKVAEDATEAGRLAAARPRPPT